MPIHHNTPNGVAYLTITRDELASCTNNRYPICDECLMGLSPGEDVTLVPVLNMAYCQRCAKAVLATIGQLSGYDKIIEKRCLQAYLNTFEQMKKPADATREPK
jgi:hypothetical protein